jgi:hypothetical protein
MSLYYDVFGTVTMPVEVLEKERNAILREIMQWSPESDADQTFSIQNINSKTVAVSFDDSDDYQSNRYHAIGEYLVRGLRALKQKYPESVKGELLIVAIGGVSYSASRIDLDEETFVLYTLQPEK